MLYQVQIRNPSLFVSSVNENNVVKLKKQYSLAADGEYLCKQLNGNLLNPCSVFIHNITMYDIIQINYNIHSLSMHDCVD